MARDALTPSYRNLALRSAVVAGKSGLEGPESLHPLGKEAADVQVDSDHSMTALFTKAQICTRGVSDHGIDPSGPVM
jgi:hypothetical protein